MQFIKRDCMLFWNFWICASRCSLIMNFYRPGSLSWPFFMIISNPLSNLWFPNKPGKRPCTWIFDRVSFSHRRDYSRRQLQQDNLDNWLAGSVENWNCRYSQILQGLLFPIIFSRDIGWMNDNRYVYNRWKLPSQRCDQNLNEMKLIIYNKDNHVHEHILNILTVY